MATSGEPISSPPSTTSSPDTITQPPKTTTPTSEVLFDPTDIPQTATITMSNLTSTPYDTGTRHKTTLHTPTSKEEIVKYGTHQRLNYEGTV